jgi:hypothetical protein
VGAGEGKQDLLWTQVVIRICDWSSGFAICELYFENHVAVLNDFIYQTGGSTSCTFTGHRFPVTRCKMLIIP